jgi:hypothetical protein
MRRFVAAPATCWHEIGDASQFSQYRAAKTSRESVFF